MFQKKEKPKKRESFIKRLRARINKGEDWLKYDLANLIPGGKIDEDALEDLESILITADVGVKTTELIIEDLRKNLLRNELKDLDTLKAGLKESLLHILGDAEKPLIIEKSENPFVIFMVGVNGAGKTTTIGKLTRQLKNDGHSVMLAAGDTFRAAAIEQLQAWGEKNNVAVIAQQSGADPAAVVFDAWQAAKARSIDILLVDTAGRLQNQSGLMDELVKMKRIVARHDESAPHEVMLILDGSQGQNALVQAKKFHEVLGITGITVTKLDGSAKGGILFAIASQLPVGIRFIGIGEGVEDMQPFRPKEFVNALLTSSDED
ncbi:MAG: signal recognition particle-docking protein FtsY [Woeseiaceae bacterium]|nr:signal recognition particle-docking protein FtsY [Woeseiaceae bacterium]